MGVVQYKFRHTHVYDGDGSTSTPNGSQHICFIPPMPELFGTHVTIYLITAGTANGTMQPRNALRGGLDDSFVSTFYGLDRWSYQQNPVAPFPYDFQPILWSYNTAYYFDPVDGSPSFRLDQQNFQGFTWALGDKIAMGGSIREEWQVVGLEPPVPSNPFPDGDSFAVPMDYWHKVGILEVAVLLMATIGVDFFNNQDIIAIISGESPSDVRGGSTIIMNNFYTDSTVMANFPKTPFPESPEIQLHYPWRSSYFPSANSSNSDYSVTLSEFSLWTWGGQRTVNVLQYFKDPEIVYTIAVDPNRILSRTYQLNTSVLHSAMAVQDEDHIVQPGDPIGQLTVAGNSFIAYYSNFPYAFVQFPKVASAQAKRFGW